MAALAVLIASPSIAQDAPADTLAQADRREYLLQIEVNGADTGIVAVFVEQRGVYFLRSEDLIRLRLRPSPQARLLTHRGERFVRLDDFAGLTLAIDEARQVAQLSVPADLFERSNFDVGVPIVPPATGDVGSFLNYDLVAAHTPAGETLGGLFELAASDGERFYATTFAASRQLDENRSARLETYLLQDDAVHLTRLRLGDTVTRGGDWGRPTRMGGIQFGSNFGFQPNFIAFPTPAIQGEASLPSTVEVYVDNALRYRGNVDSGPFSIRQVPIVTGAGDVKVVVRDVLGVERVITTPFYASPRVLRPGLHDYSYEIGVERENFGFESFDYGHPFASGTHRYGLIENLTGEIHAEMASDQQTIGSGLVFLLPEIGEFSGSVAGSTSEGRTGALGKVGYSRVGRSWSFAASHQQATDDFVQIGARTPARQITRLSQATLGWSFGDYGGVGLGVSRLEFGDRTQFDVATLTYGIQVGERAYVNLFAVRADSGEADTTFGLGVTVPLGPRRTASTQVNGGGGRTTGTVEYRERAPSEGGFGYRLLANRGAIDRTEGGVSWESSYGIVTGDVSNAPDGTSGRLLGSGGFAFAGGGLYPTRRIDDGFAIVSVPQFNDVSIYRENRLVGRTGSDGTIILPNVLSYNENRIRLETNDLPVDALVERDSLTVVPRYRTPVIVRFPVQRAEAVTFIAVTQDGAPLPAGISIKVEGSELEFFTGFGGEVYATGVEQGAILRAEWESSTCWIAVGAFARAPGEPAASLGELVCYPVEAL